MGKVALVTGSSRGIGRAIALKLAEDGYDVCINYEKRKDKAEETAGLARGLGSRAVTFQADVSDRAAVERMFAFVRENLGEVDLLVSNAGIAGQVQIQDITKERWDRFFQVNVNGAFNTVQCAIPHMLHEKKGCIITISSMWGLRGASCESAYSATKAALIGFTRSLANELAPSGIRVNCIAPGVIDTDMLDELPEGVKDTLADETPLGRLGKPEDIADLVSFIASEKAGFITGQVITSDGGFVV
ncbi:MAG: SDR family oxidoreductase [Lachnospiraceae bacterium]|nr:SDR family oxidoreductase [Lachnospiraceae bacterium]